MKYRYWVISDYGYIKCAVANSKKQYKEEKKAWERAGMEVILDDQNSKGTRTRM